MSDSPAPATHTSGPPARKRLGVRHVLSVLVAVAVVVAVFGFALPKFASYSKAWTTIAAMAGWEVALLAVLAVARLGVPALQMMAGLPGAGFWPAFAAINWGSAMSNTVPAGGAFGVGVMYEMLVSWGSSAEAITRELIVTGIWNDLVRLAMPVAAVLVLAVSGEAEGDALHLALVGLLVLIVVVGLLLFLLRSERLARALGERGARVASWVLRFAGRPPVSGWGDRAVEFDRATGVVVRERWRVLTESTLLMELSLFLLVFLCVRFSGIPASRVTASEVFAAYVFMRVLQIVPITPGGLGVVQLGLAGALGQFGAPAAAATAAALVYTALSWLPPIPAGVASFVVWRRRWARKGPTAPRSAASPGT